MKAVYLRRTIAGLVVFMGLQLASVGVQAAWQIDSDESTINFVSIKNGTIGETHYFSSVEGTLDKQGKLQLTIDLDTVETAIAIRNQRVRELLFETGKFPTAIISAAIDPALLDRALSGEVVRAEVPVALDLHGRHQAVSVPVVVIREAGDRFRVYSIKPVLISAADFGLVDGLSALQKIAGLRSISTAVPVTLQLLFVPVPEDSPSAAIER